MSLSEKVQQINREISATVERAVADLRQEVSQQLRAGHDEILRRLGEIRPELPSSFLPEDIGLLTEEMAEERAQERVEERARQAAQEAAREATETAEQGASERISAARHEALTEVRDALANIDRARSQAEILAALLRETGRFSSRAAVLLLRGNEIRGWGGHGFGEAEPGIRDLSFASVDGSGWGRLAEGQTAVHLSAAECAELCSRIEAPLPREGVLIPLVLRDRVAAGLYADRLRGGLDPAALQVLCYTAAMAIELLPFRERPFTPTLALEGAPSGGESPAPESIAPPAEAPAASAVSAPEPEPEPVQETQGLSSVPSFDESPVAVSETETETEPELEVEYEIEADPEVADVVDVAAETAPEPESWAAREPEPQEPPRPYFEETPEPSPAATVYQPIPVPGFQDAPAAPEPAAPAGSADQTVLLQRVVPPPLPPQAAPEPPAPAEVAAPAPAPLRPVPAAEPAPAAASGGTGGDGATPEVRPPSDVQGPGWAFSASRAAAVAPSNEDAQHEEARRLARLLVSEIKLYNEEQVEEGRRKRDVYERLREDIDRSRQMYEERVEARILKSTDYFYQELVRILAAGDAKALGI